MASSSTPAAKKPVDPKVTDNDSTNTQAKFKQPEHPGTHPASFEPMNLERDFTPTDDPDLDEPGRWLANEFFAATGPTTVVRLDELTNLGNKTYEGRGDTSDRQLASQVIMRAGLGDHPRFNQLVDMMAVGLGEIDDPGKWLHGYGKDSASKRTRESDSSSDSSAG
jgi:hypothetical protein